MFMQDRNVPKGLNHIYFSNPNSASSSEEMDGLDSTQMFKDLNEDNLKIFSDALGTRFHNIKQLLRRLQVLSFLCRSGMRKVKNYFLKERRQARNLDVLSWCWF
ncbi:unnamed protein product [Lupinus luteus]|uniref:Uncharacterized protein n=1 Tax=Lupinus luteus TaxID=3873 RepID=A0AAV1YJ85_LUPLU